MDFGGRPDAAGGGETERELRYQHRDMIVSLRGRVTAPSRVVPQERYTLLSQQNTICGDRSFCFPAKKRKEANTMAEKIPYKIYLTENEIPKQWYNVREIGRAHV